MTALKSLLDTQNDMPLTEAQRDTLTQLLSLEKRKVAVDPSAKHIKYMDVTPMFTAETDMPSVLRVLYERLVWAQLEQKVTRALALWISIICEDEHYSSVLWAYTIYQWHKTHPVHVITLSEWATTVMANGLPSAETRREAWQLQKRQDAPNGNALDMPENWL